MDVPYFQPPHEEPETTEPRKYIYLDSETLRFFQDSEIAALPRSEQLKNLQLALVCTYSESDGFQDFWAEKHGDLDRLWQYINQSNVTLVGWNLIDFDLPLLEHTIICEGISDRLVSQYNVLDLFAEIKWSTGRWYKLGVVTEANGFGDKLADGQQAAAWLRSGDPESMQEAVAYCRRDVELVRDLHALLLTGGELLLPARPERKEQGDIRWELNDIPF